MVLVAVLAAIAFVLYAVFVPKGRPHNHGPSCVNNLKNIGLAYRIFSTDNNGLFPWAVSTNAGGTAEIPQDAANVWRQYAALSNELSSPKILACPQDSERRYASNFNCLANTNLSYFLGLLADETQPDTILAGDRNLTINRAPVAPGLLRLRTNQHAGFSMGIHTNAGNILLGDGSVQMVTGPRLRQAVVAAAASSTNAVNRLLIP
jgi:prepilin-type processing-associated H-X9-DG protein